MKTVLGLDPGLANTGWACVRRTASGYQLINSGYQTTSTKASFGDRLDSQFITIHDRLMAYKPDILAIEACFFNKNISSHNATVSVIAMAELAAYRLGIPTLQIKPQLVKAAVTGRSTAAKEHIKVMVNRLLNTDIKNHHEADACAVAVAGLLKGIK